MKRKFVGTHFRLHTRAQYDTMHTSSRLHMHHFASTFQKGPLQAIYPSHEQTTAGTIISAVDRFCTLINHCTHQQAQSNHGLHLIHLIHLSDLCRLHMSNLPVSEDSGVRQSVLFDPPEQEAIPDTAYRLYRSTHMTRKKKPTTSVIIGRVSLPAFRNPANEKFASSAPFHHAASLEKRGHVHVPCGPTSKPIAELNTTGSTLGPE